MKKVILAWLLYSSCLSVLQAQSEEVVPLVDFLEKQSKSAKEYILDQFLDKDIVIFCERAHSDITQYALIWDIITDPYFIDNVGAVYTEVGMDNIAPRIDRLLLSEGLDSLRLREEVTGILRDADYDPFPWLNRSWPLLITRLYEFNQALPVSHKLRMFPVDYSLDWGKIQTRQEYVEVDDQIDEFRDSVMAYNFMRRYESMPPRNGHKKALLIMNYRHAFLKHLRSIDNKVLENCGKYIYDVYGDKVASVMISGLGLPHDNNKQDVVQEGLWDAAFELANKTDIGFDLQNTPLGETQCDLYPESRRVDGYFYQDLFTGIVYYLPIERHITAIGWEGTLSEGFKEEFLRRFAIGTDGDIEHLSDTFPEFMEYFNQVAISEYEDLPSMRAKIDKWKQ